MLKNEVFYSDEFGLRYYRHGERHRKDSPASIWPDGEYKWFQYGVLHRRNGHAVIWPDIRLKEYWIRGEHLTQYQRIFRWIRKICYRMKCNTLFIAAM